MYNYMVAQIQNFKLQMQYMVDKLHGRNLLHLNKLNERNKTMYNSMSDQHQNVKLQMQPQAVPGSGLYISKVAPQPQAVPGSDIFLSQVTPQNILVSYDLAPDPDPVQRIARDFNEPSNIDPRTSRLRTQTRFITPLSCDLEPNTTKTNYRKCFVSADLGPDMSASVDSGGVIA